MNWELLFASLNLTMAWWLMNSEHRMRPEAPIIARWICVIAAILNLYAGLAQLPTFK